MPKQLDHSAQLPGGGSQKLIFQATTTITGIALWVSPGAGGFCCSESFVSFYDDAGGSVGTQVATDGPGNLIATTSPVLFTFRAPQSEWVYMFPQPVVVSPGGYWFAVTKGPDQWNDTNVFGSSGDAYPEGEWLNATSEDAYFRME